MPWGLRHEVFHDRYVNRRTLKEAAETSEVSYHKSGREHCSPPTVSLVPAAHDPDLISRVTALEEELTWIKQLMQSDHQAARIRDEHLEVAASTVHDVSQAPAKTHNDTRSDNLGVAGGCDGMRECSTGFDGPMLASVRSELQNLQEELTKQVASCQSRLDELSAQLVSSCEDLRLKHSEVMVCLQEKVNELKIGTHETVPCTLHDDLLETPLNTPLVVDRIGVISKSKNNFQSQCRLDSRGSNQNQHHSDSRGSNQMQHRLSSPGGAQLVGTWENLFAGVQK